MKREEFVKIYNSGVDATYDIFLNLQEKIEELSKIIEAQNKKIKNLEKILSKDSNNSSKPPSTDGFKKNKKFFNNSYHFLLFQFIGVRVKNMEFLIMLKFKKTLGQQ